MNNVTIRISDLIFPFHVQVYKGLSLGCFHFWNRVSNFTVVDYSAVLFFRLFSSNFDIKTVSTSRQRKIQREIKEAQERLGTQSIQTKMSHHAANLIYELIPQIISEKLDVLPACLEKMLFFQIKLWVYYVHRQIIKRCDYRSAFLNSSWGRDTKVFYKKVKNYVIYSLFSRLNVEPLMNFELILLKFFEKVDNDPVHKNLVFISIKTLAESFERETCLTKNEAISREEQMILRLDLFARKKWLPPGVPNPQEYRVSTQNLQKQLDRSLFEGVKKIISRYVASNVQISKMTILGLIYELEGRDLLVNILTTLLVDQCIKPVINPHLFAICILQAAGVETISYEPAGFGSKKELLIFELGKKILEDHRCDPSTLIDRTGLSWCPMGADLIMQQQAVRERLTLLFFTAIYDIVKNGGKLKSEDSVFKSIREKAFDFPIVNIATIFLHVLINGLFFSFSYPFRNADMKEHSFFSFMFQKFSGKRFCQVFSSRLVELVYHPLWYMTVLQLLDNVINTNGAELTTRDFQTFNHFLCSHFMSTDPFKEKIVEYFIKDKFFEALTASTRTLGSPMNTVCGSLLEVVKELTLSTRITGFIRKRHQCLFLEDNSKGDSKFWEFFLRIVLKKLIGDSTQHSREYAASVRKTLVDKMQVMSNDELGRFLGNAVNEAVVDLNGTVVMYDHSALIRELHETLF